MKRIILIICLLLSTSATMAQPLKFSQPQWDFGTIKEDGGTVSHNFEFTNNTSSPIIITDVRTTCGCTTPNFSKRPIAPNATSSLEIIYDPLYRPGSFARDISIYTSASNDPVIIKITGVATPRERSISESFPYMVGDGVRISSLYSYMQNVSPSSPQQTLIEIINSSKETKRIEFKSSDTNSYLNIYAPTQLLEGERGAINLSYAIPARGGLYGELNDYIDIYVDGVKSNLTLRTRAYAIEDFDTLLKKGGASGRFSEKLINFGAFSLSSGSTSKSFSIENLGTESLFIRAIDLPEGVNITPEEGGESVGLRIDPSERVELAVTLDKKSIELGAMVKYITFTLNDPDQPVVRVKIVGEVSR